jgi:uncharacterized protein YaiE (UPF0345 family)
MAILDDVKNELRISGTDHDTEITALINAAKLDLEESGVCKVVDTDYLIRMAIGLYCKGNFGFDNAEAERFLQAYDSLRVKLSVASDYNAFKVVFTVTALTTSGAAIDGASIVIDDADLTEVVTNSLGVATYYQYTKNADVDYTVYADGYTTQTGSVYVDNDEAVAVVVV